MVLGEFLPLDGVDSGDEVGYFGDVFFFVVTDVGEEVFDFLVVDIVDVGLILVYGLQFAHQVFPEPDDELLQGRCLEAAAGFRLAVCYPLLKIVHLPAAARPVADAIAYCQGEVLEIIDLESRVGDADWDAAIRRLVRR